MEVNSSIQITPAQGEMLQGLLDKYLPGVKVWAYGSRVKGTSRPASDLDLVVFSAPEQAGRVSQLREALEESNLPFRVDLFVWDDVPEQFRHAIEREHISLGR